VLTSTHDERRPSLLFLGQTNKAARHEVLTSPHESRFSDGGTDKPSQPTRDVFGNKRSTVTVLVVGERS
jgi:hypothetical protein